MEYERKNSEESYKTAEFGSVRFEMIKQITKKNTSCNLD